MPNSVYRLWRYSTSDVTFEMSSIRPEGSVVVALLDDEATLKRFYRDKENQKILLVPENDNYETRVVDYCRIQGIARKVIILLLEEYGC